VDAFRAPPPSFVVARGLGTVDHDRREAHVLRASIGDAVPVTAFKGATAYLGAASALVDVALAIRALEARIIPPVVRLRDAGEGCALSFVRRPLPLPSHSARAVVLSAGWDDAWAAIALAGGLH
jgi:3-oxoacyl-(acyl-carrier-protein) synthase